MPAIRAAVRDPLLLIAGPIDAAVLAASTADAWHMWHQSTQHRADLGRLLPRLITDARIAARAAGGHDRRAAHAVLADVYALVQHEVVGASEIELTRTAADRAMTAAQEADTPAALAGAAPAPASSPGMGVSFGCGVRRRPGQVAGDRPGRAGPPATAVDAARRGGTAATDVVDGILFLESLPDITGEIVHIDGAPKSPGHGR